MTNFFESIKDMFSSVVDGEDKKPLHIGEVNHFWLLLALLEEGLTIYQIGMNSTNDDQLLHALKNGEQSSRETIKKLELFFQNEGIPLPPFSGNKTKSEPDAIPLGVKQTDYEIANLVSAKVAAEVTLLGQALAMAIRTDAAKLFLEIEIEILKYGTALKNMMRQRGWLKIPPYYYPPGAPNK